MGNATIKSFICLCYLCHTTIIAYISKMAVCYSQALYFNNFAFLFLVWLLILFLFFLSCSFLSHCEQNLVFSFIHIGFSKPLLSNAVNFVDWLIPSRNEKKKECIYNSIWSNAIYSRVEQFFPITRMTSAT